LHAQKASAILLMENPCKWKGNHQW
jgi:hypothetical protein